MTAAIATREWDAADTAALVVILFALLAALVFALYRKQRGVLTRGYTQLVAVESEVTRNRVALEALVTRLEALSRLETVEKEVLRSREQFADLVKEVTIPMMEHVMRTPQNAMTRAAIEALVDERLARHNG